MFSGLIPLDIHAGRGTQEWYDGAAAPMLVLHQQPTTCVGACCALKLLALETAECTAQSPTQSRCVWEAQSRLQHGYSALPWAPGLLLYDFYQMIWLQSPSAVPQSAFLI